jgi:hypothetical protein
MQNSCKTIYLRNMVCFTYIHSIEVKTRMMMIIIIIIIIIIIT